MHSNMSPVDRTIRVLFAAMVAFLYLVNFISGTVALVLGIIGAVLLLTAFINFCPLYKIFGISTRGKGK